MRILRDKALLSLLYYFEQIFGYMVADLFQPVYFHWIFLATFLIASLCTLLNLGIGGRKILRK